MRRNSAHFFQSQTLRVCSFKIMLAFLAFICIKISLIYPFLNSWKTRKQLSVKTERCVEIRRIFFSHRQTKRQNCQKQSFSRQKSSKYFVFCSDTYSSSMLPLNKTCLSCFFLLKTNAVDNLAFWESPFKIMLAFLAFVCIKISLIYPFLNSGKQANNFRWRRRGGVEKRRIFA